MNDILNLCSTALTASTAALKNTSSNLANMNTAGYRGTRMSFASLFDAGTGSNARTANGGVMATAATLNMKPGGYVTTGNGLDLAILGNGFFVLKDADGNLSYTREGKFEWGENNKLVARDGSVVQALQNGGLVDLTYADAMTHAGQATTAITFAKAGVNVLTNAPSASPTTPQTVTAPITVFDSAGKPHELSMTFTKRSPPAGDPNPIQWEVAIKEGAIDIGSPTPAFVLKFDTVTNKPVIGGSEFEFQYKPAGLEAMTVKVDCAELKTGGGTSSISASANGQASGELQVENLTFAEDGALKLLYSNGHSAKGPSIALGMADRASDWIQVGSSRFEIAAGGSVKHGTAGEAFGKISAGQLEGSNVDVSQEFSDLIVAQRMYQSASQVIQATSTLNDALLRAAGGR